MKAWIDSMCPLLIRYSSFTAFKTGAIALVVHDAAESTSPDSIMP